MMLSYMLTNYYPFWISHQDKWIFKRCSCYRELNILSLIWTYSAPNRCVHVITELSRIFGALYINPFYYFMYSERVKKIELVWFKVISDTVKVMVIHTLHILTWKLVWIYTGIFSFKFTVVEFVVGTKNG